MSAFLRGIEHSQWRAPTAADRAAELYEECRAASRPLEMLAEFLAEAADFDMDQPTRSDAERMQRLTASVEAALIACGEKDAAMAYAKRRRTQLRKACTVEEMPLFGEVLPRLEGLT